MRTFAQKQTTTQQILPAKQTMPSRAYFGQSRDLDSSHNVLHLINNQTGEPNTYGNSCFGALFSRIPIHTVASGTIQTKLIVNQPGDMWEQEADRISEQVMRITEPQLQQPHANGACPKYRAEQLERGYGPVQVQRIASEDLLGEQTEVQPIVHDVLRSAGQPIDTATLAFMQRRFGHDFSRVRIHLDREAAKSAKSIHALAYTSGNHIVFNDGQYKPATESGKRLLAHELVHTLQQGNNILQRKIDFTEPKPILADPIPLVLGGESILGNTLPGFNKKLLPPKGIKKDYKETVFKVLQPENFRFSDKQNGKTCKVDTNNYNINVFAEVRAITEPKKNKWSGSYPPTVLSNPPSVCTKAKNEIQVEMKGEPDSKALYQKVLTHEGEHVTDLKNLTNKELKPYHDFLIGLTASGKTEQDCVNDIFKQVGKKDAEAANNFVDKWLEAVHGYDKKGGAHHSKFETEVDPKCTNMEIKEKI